jgi:lipoyl(octanoyl) transferase
MIQWRLLVTGPGDGAYNMALDEALLESAIAGGAPVLRIYSWKPPAVSLGYFQELDEGIDRAEISRRGFGLVRRPTGGRAILHKDELTYAVAAREDDIAHGDSLMGSYRTISRGIEAGLQMLGVAARLADRSGEGRKQDRQTLPTVCFGQPAKVDMLVASRKIVGSAQTRRDGALLQHGSIPVSIDPAEHLAVMPGGLNTNERAAGSAETLAELMCGIADIIGRTPTFDEVAQALEAGFVSALGISFVSDELSAAESSATTRLITEKYGNDAWTAQGGTR